MDTNYLNSLLNPWEIFFEVCGLMTKFSFWVTIVGKQAVDFAFHRWKEALSLRNEVEMAVQDFKISSNPGIGIGHNHILM